jgi:hypothetical protein
MLQYRQFVFDDWRKRRKYEKTNWLSAPDSYWDESEVLRKPALHITKSLNQNNYFNFFLKS